MNKVVIVARMVRDVEMRYSTGENATAMARFTVALQRKFKNTNGVYDADFPNCIAFGKTAEFINQYFHKGDIIGIDGRITTGSYVNREGVKVYTTEVTVESAEFVGNKNDTANIDNDINEVKPTSQNTDWMNIPEGSEEELPY